MIVWSGSVVDAGPVPRTNGSGSRRPKKHPALFYQHWFLEGFAWRKKADFGWISTADLLFSLQTVGERRAGERAPGQGRQGGEHRIRTSGEKATACWNRNIHENTYCVLFLLIFRMRICIRNLENCNKDLKVLAKIINDFIKLSPLANILDKVILCLSCCIDKVAYLSPFPFLSSSFFQILSSFIFFIPLCVIIWTLPASPFFYSNQYQHCLSFTFCSSSQSCFFCHCPLFSDYQAS